MPKKSPTREMVDQEILKIIKDLKERNFTVPDIAMILNRSERNIFYRLSTG